MSNFLSMIKAFVAPAASIILNKPIKIGTSFTTSDDADNATIVNLPSSGLGPLYTNTANGQEFSLMSEYKLGDFTVYRLYDHAKREIIEVDGVAFKRYYTLSSVKE